MGDIGLARAQSGRPLSRRKMGMSTLSVKPRGAAQGPPRRYGVHLAGPKTAMRLARFKSRNEVVAGSDRDYGSRRRAVHSTASKQSSSAVHPCAHRVRCRKGTASQFQPVESSWPQFHRPACGEFRAGPTRAWVRPGEQGYVDRHVYRDDGVAAGNGARTELCVGADRRGPAAVRRDLSRRSRFQSRRLAAIA